MNILAEQKPKALILADGVEYTLPPIDLTTLANIEKVMGFGLNKLAEKIESESMTTMRSLIYALLKEKHPELDIDSVGHLITLKEISAIAGTISEIMALT